MTKADTQRGPYTKRLTAKDHCRSDIRKKDSILVFILERFREQKKDDQIIKMIITILRNTQHLFKDRLSNDIAYC